MMDNGGGWPVGPFKDLTDQLALLFVAGAGGAFWRAAIAPEQEWKRRVAQGVAGALSAVFLGGILAQMLTRLFPGGGDWVWLAAGFLMGSGGEVAVRAVQDRLMGTKREAKK